ncbi:two-component system response regulator YesN [Anaerobacterium chartisolvens]|uniref:Stage 0 sporulation protein A homolog n=1 Tax=Anaerobacterium chartisolvens TaxID=1297424 RepID=A0A369AUI1_9FIRM|nr:response regulator [Anaerobacterium chartisolvens]RCX12989.1 two-component system response regulator YesN [Anaerobacterium chartisolvens]
MYKVLVVEDNKLILKDITDQLESINSRLKVVAAAFDGEEALEILKREDIDILFTDIKMPVKDGLTLVNEGKKISPSLKCVIISGYGDFEYARQAIKLQIDGYILKPIDPGELEAVIEKITGEIDTAKELVLEKTLSRLLMNTYSGELDLIPFKDKSFVLSVVRTGLSRKGPQSLENNNVKKYISEGSNIDFNIIDTEFISEKVIIYNTSEHEPEHFLLNAELLFNKLVKEYPQINIITSSRISDISKLCDRYTRLSQELSCQIILGKSQILFENNVNSIDLKLLNELSYKLKRKYDLLMKNSPLNSLFNKIEADLCEWEQKSFNLLYIKRFLTIMIECLYEANNAINIPQLDISLDVEQLLYPCNTYQDLKKNMINHVKSFFDGLTESENISLKELIEKIGQFIQSNLYNSITLQDLADKFDLTSSYICRIFKSQFSISPMAYYMNLKIEEAKKLLRSDNDILIKNISDTLRFSDQFYFSKVFKMYTGMSPQEYKKSEER